MITATTQKKTKVVSTAKLKKENSLVKKENSRIKRELELFKNREFEFKLTAEEIKAIRELAADKLMEVENEISDYEIDFNLPSTISIFMKHKKEFFERLFDKLNFNE